jgi:uncharacterized zinc-type alcohol dehydrogenase-like protein
MLVQAYGAHAGDKPLEPLQIIRRTPATHDVQIDIAFCGICHSDLHQVRAEWAGTQFSGKKIGVVGIGGLGHMGIKLAHAMGAHVVAFTTSESKREAAKEMAAHAKSFDFILNTVAAPPPTISMPSWFYSSAMVR